MFLHENENHKIIPKSVIQVFCSKWNLIINSITNATSTFLPFGYNSIKIKGSRGHTIKG